MSTHWHITLVSLSWQHHRALQLVYIHLNIAIARAIVASPRTISKKNLPHVWNVMWQKTQLKQFNQIEKVFFRNRWKENAGETNQTVNTFKPWLSLSLCFVWFSHLKIVYYVCSYRASMRCTSLSFVCRNITRVCVCTPVTFDFWPPGVKRQDRRRWVRLPLGKKKKREPSPVKRILPGHVGEGKVFSKEEERERGGARTSHRYKTGGCCKSQRPVGRLDSYQKERRRHTHRASSSTTTY